MSEVRPACAACGRLIADIPEYKFRMQAEGMTLLEVCRDDGTWNERERVLWCTTCYVNMGMPVGRASGARSVLYARAHHPARGIGR